MKFLCSNCKAKYQIPDEKIAGRTLKMDCRRCSTPIVIRGDLGVPEDAEEMAEGSHDPGAARAGSRPGAPAAAAPSAAAPTGSAAGSVRRPAPAGRPLGTSGSSSVGPHPTAVARTSTRGMLGADFRRNVGAAAEPPRAITPLDQWHVAINDVPVGPMKRDEISRKIAAGAVNGESLAWREGFDDWRPLREIPELAALMRRAAPAESERPPARGAPRAPAPRAPAPRPGGVTAGRPGAPPAAARPAARSNVVAIGGRLGASAAPAIDADDLEEESESRLGDSEATTVASAADLGLADFGNLAQRDKAKAPTKASPDVELDLAEPAARRAEPAKPARPPSAALKPSAPVSAASAGALPGLGIPPRPASAPRVEPAHKAAPTAEPIGASGARGPFAPPPAEPLIVAPSPALAPAAAATARPLPTPAQDKGPRVGIGAMMGIGFAMAAGAVLMYGVVQRYVLAPASPAAVATVVSVATPPEAPHVAPVVAAVDEPVVPAPADPTTPAATTPSGHHSTTTSTGAHSATKTTTPTTTTPTTTTTPAGSSRFDQFADQGSGPAAIATGPATTHHEDGPSAPRTELTEAQISEVRRREQRSLQTCWETAIRGMRDVGDVRMDIDITIGASGSVTSARARGPGVGTLSDCIEQRVRRWRFPASSEPTQLTFPVVFAGL